MPGDLTLVKVPSSGYNEASVLTLSNSNVSTLSVTNYDVTVINTSSGEITVPAVIYNDFTNVTLSSSDISVVQVTTSDVTILNSSAATLSVPTAMNLSDSIPAELTENGVAGISSLASRSDHSHPMVNLILNGGNF